jgi:hypothetical protein
MTRSPARACVSPAFKGVRGNETREIPGADIRVRSDYEAGLNDKYFVMVCIQALRSPGKSNPGPEEEYEIE